jgi:hypothetical protein
MDTFADDRLSREDMLLVLILVLFTTVFRLMTLQMISTGVDASDYWNAAKAIISGGDFPELTHRTVRWGVILPVALIQLLFGHGPLAYYIAPILFQGLQTLLVFLIGRRISGRLCGFLAAIAMVVFPFAARVGSQILPETVSPVYVLGAFWFLLRYLDVRNTGRNPKLPDLIPSAFFLYLAYHAKITNLYFLPGFLLIIWLIGKSSIHALYFGMMLLGMYLLETGLYAVFTDYNLGHIQIILSHHFSDPAEGGIVISEYPFSGFFALFNRYREPYLQWYWQFPFALFGVSAMSYLFRRKSTGRSALYIAAASFFAMITFTFRSLDPLLLIEHFINRYFYAVLGFVAVALAADVREVLDKLMKSPIIAAVMSVLRSRRILLAVASAVLLSAAVPLALLTGPGQRFASDFAWDPRNPSSHALARTARYANMLNESAAEGIALVAETGIAGGNALRTARVYFLNPSWAESRAYGRKAGEYRTDYNGMQLQYFGRQEGLDLSLEETVIAVRRDPFEMRKIAPEDLNSYFN